MCLETKAFMTSYKGSSHYFFEDLSPSRTGVFKLSAGVPGNEI